MRGKLTADKCGQRYPDTHEEADTCAFAAVHAADAGLQSTIIIAEDTDPRRTTVPTTR